MKLILIRERKFQGNYVYYPIEVIEYLTGRVDNEIPNIDVFLSKIGVAKSVFYSPVKRSNITDIRYAVCKVLREKGLSYQKIGDIIGRNHDTVFYMVGKYQPYNEKLVNEYLELLRTKI
jgi:chromosomal replication initiation ATPase DnaA